MAVAGQEAFTTDGKTIDWFDLTRIFHHGTSQGWRCDICNHQPVFKSVSEIVAHCRYFHILADISVKAKEATTVEEEFVMEEQGGEEEGASKEGGNSRKNSFLSFFIRSSPRRNLEMRGV
jgi:hypothetical protein